MMSFNVLFDSILRTFLSGGHDALLESQHWKIINILIIDTQRLTFRQKNRSDSISAKVGFISQ